jgi:hypothetical protein
MPEPWEEESSPWAADDPGAPAVLGQQQAQSEALSGGVVYVPAQRFAPGSDTASPELRLLDDGRTALLVFSSLDLLVSGCGQAQPWIKVRLASPDALKELARLAGANVVLRDVEVPVEVRRTDSSTRDTKRRDEDERS